MGTIVQPYRLIGGKRGWHLMGRCSTYAKQARGGVVPPAGVADSISVVSPLAGLVFLRWGMGTPAYAGVYEPIAATRL